MRVKKETKLKIIERLALLEAVFENMDERLTALEETVYKN